MISWQQFGLRSNPYDTLPLVEGGELSIERAFIGRTDELHMLKNILLSDSRACLTILGNVGVGKTSFTNFGKYILKHREMSRPLFSFRREIEASRYLLNKYNFLIEVIGSVLREIRLLDPTLISSQNLLKKLERVVDITQTLGISGSVQMGVASAGFSEGDINLPSSLPLSMLEGYFSDLVHLIMTHKIADKQYCGLIVHVNNFDTLLSDVEAGKDVVRFFQEVRDLLQTPNVYFLFLGPQRLFKEYILSSKRIKGIFHLSPIVLAPLSKTEVIDAINERMELLRSPGVVNYIAPFSNDTIYALYDLYEGDVRSVMNGLKTILAQISETVVEPLGPNEALLLLGKERWDQLEKLNLTKEQIEILQLISASPEAITQKELILLTNKAPSNISGYYLSPLLERGIIELKSKQGKIKYYGLTQEYAPVKYINKNNAIVKKRADSLTAQLKLFEQ